MKKFLIILTVAFAVFVISGCASINSTTNWYTTNANITIEKRGEETATVWLGLFGEYNFPPAEKVARDNGISKIATVERYYKPGVFGLWFEYTTIVTGE
ncbi:MAG: TRL-like family protein [Treponema sp.]|jgi:predicted small lipoprotein YifL|nr:TRL-like family protein [Treponema sp.]